MGKSSKFFKILLDSVKPFRSPSKVKTSENSHCKEDDKEHQKRTPKEKRRWSLGKSSSRNRDVESIIPLAPSDINGNSANTQLENQQWGDSVDVMKRNTENPPVEPEKVVDGPESAAISLSAQLDVPITFNDIRDAHSSQVIVADDNSSSSISRSEEGATVKIQAAFRGYLARRAVQALKATISLQSLIRGRIVRKQAATTLRCIKALVRVQAHVRAFLVQRSEEGQIVQQRVYRRRLQIKEGWKTSSCNMNSLQARNCRQGIGESKQVELRSDCYDHRINGHWAFSWLERWTNAKPWVPSFAPIIVSTQQHQVNDIFLAKRVEQTSTQYLPAPAENSIWNSSSIIPPPPPPPLPPKKLLFPLPMPPNTLAAQQRPPLIPTSLDLHVSSSTSLYMATLPLQKLTPPPDITNPNCLPDHDDASSYGGAILAEAAPEMDEDRVVEDRKEQQPSVGFEDEAGMIDGHNGENATSSVSPKTPSTHCSRSSTGNTPKRTLSHQENAVCSGSPPIPSYMATTQSSKAKTRSHGSPVKKQETQSPPPRKKSPASEQRAISHHIRTSSKGSMHFLKE